MDDRIAYSEATASEHRTAAPIAPSPAVPIPAAHSRPRPARPTPRGSARFKQHKAKAMKWVRRIHLFSGLALVPFVLLYGLSGIFFNHPAIGSDLRDHAIDAATLRAAGATPPLSATTLAATVIARLAATDEGAGFSADPAHPARFTGSFSVQQSGDGATWFLSAGTDLGSARLTERPDRTQVERSLDLELDGVDTGIDATTAALEALLSQRSGTTRSSWRRVPSLEFGLLDAEGLPHLARFDLRSGELQARPVHDAESLDFASLLKRMHKSHGYPDEAGTTRWFWAILADTMGVAMVIWGLSGLAMWWQMKNLRRVGAVAVVVGVAAAIALAKGFLAA